MILRADYGKLYEVKLAFLGLLDPSSVKPRYFSSSEQIISFLKPNPNVRFTLTAVPPGSSFELTIMSDFEAYGPQLGDVLCGVISYDPIKNKVLTVGIYVPPDTGRIWSG